ncbi:D-hexose-6-phosphate mutarotase [Pseudoduganella albidiflava]|uniref:Putative glucose-6-phosphate 1-epimerase n=1 Tax=Pseudoduganella albidiflava TaxID=321983 RepID=A0A411WTP6_9BURK|nr:D-hexose-6-phosphate mutarotase [Pseudoduganella albidiflava]QBH99856.1 D-hexose-6-phosphate mutarotase [Pseudoduganella albidiflava]GGY54426.1 D-hexose-6-phosphate mutarotase [Pseudoduganella albidiflava]
MQETTFGQLPAVSITAPDGAQATIALYGAHLVSWRTADGRERLFMSEASPRDGSAAIRGGVPVIFPQFSTRGPGQRHGIARLSHWRLGDHGNDATTAWAEFLLTQEDVPAELARGWPHAFALALRFTLRPDGLEMRFHVRNTGGEPFDFACALHTYYAVDAFTGTVLTGLPDTSPLNFGPPLDNVYPAPAGLTLQPGTGTVQLAQQGFTEFVVWNPGAEAAARLTDLRDDEWQRFVCIEPARVDQQPLAAGADWTGVHTITVAP